MVFDYFSHSCLKMCKIDLKRKLDTTFLVCLALMFCDVTVVGDLLPEWACLTLQGLLGGTTFRLTSNLADISISRVRKIALHSPDSTHPVDKH